MSGTELATIAAAVTAWVLCAWQAIQIRRWTQERRQRRAEMERKVEELGVAVCLMGRLAADSFIEHRLPLWAAWHGVMGEITVNTRGHTWEIDVP